MSVVIKGMKMPKGCLECQFKDIGMSTMTQCLLVEDGWVEYANNGFGIPDACPLVDLPEKHGRLIDCNSLEKEVCPGCINKDVKYANCIGCAIANAPTIIEAEGE